MGVLTKIVIVVIVVLLAGVLILGYFGFVPILSELMGANKPVDLGVKTTSGDLSSANSKLGVTITTLPPTDNGAESLTRSGEQHVVTILSAAELTALLNDHSQKWKYYPVKDIQVKIGDDGTIEMSGVLLADRFKGFAEAVGVPEDTRAQVRPYLAAIASNPSIYIKGKLSVDNGNVQTSLDTIQIGKVSFNADQIQTYKYVVDSFIQQRANGKIIHINSASFSNGSVNLDMTIPMEVGLTPP